MNSKFIDELNNWNLPKDILEQCKIQYSEVENMDPEKRRDYIFY